MFNSNWEKSGDVGNHQRPSLPKEECGRFVAGWLLFAPQSWGGGGGRVWITERIEEPASTRVPPLSPSPESPPRHTQPHPNGAQFLRCLTLGMWISGFWVEGFIHRWFTLPEPVSRCKPGGDTVDSKPQGTTYLCSCPLSFILPGPQPPPPLLPLGKGAGQTQSTIGAEPQNNCITCEMGRRTVGSNPIYFYSQ